MTEKRLFVGRKKCEDRFTIITDYDGEIGVKENRSGDVLVLKHSDLNAQQFVAQLIVFLNDQNQAIVDLYDGSKYWSDKATEKIKELEEENEQLKDALNQRTDQCDKYYKKNEQLKNKIDVLEDDNETYHKSLEQLNLYTKRFIPTKCTNEFKDCKTNRYYWLDHEGNFKGCLELLNLLDCENEVLKSDNNRLVNETAKIIAEHQGRVLDLIDKSLEKDKHDYEMSYEDYLNGRIEALEDLKKELQE